MALLCSVLRHFKAKDLVDRKIHSMILLPKVVHHFLVKLLEVIVWLDVPVGLVFRVCNNSCLGRICKPKTGRQDGVDSLRRWSQDRSDRSFG